MVLVQKWSFFQLFFNVIQAREMSFTIFQKEKTPFLAIKTRSFKSQKIDIFPKELTHGLVQKWPFFQFFFLGIQARKMSFTIFQTKNKPFQAIKIRTSKSRKTDIFPKGLTHGQFWSKNGRFSNFYFSFNIGHENVFYDIVNRKNAFVAYKNKKFKKSKN